MTITDTPIPLPTGWSLAAAEAWVYGETGVARHEFPVLALLPADNHERFGYWVPLLLVEGKPLSALEWLEAERDGEEWNDAARYIGDLFPPGTETSWPDDLSYLVHRATTKVPWSEAAR